jgi:phosphoribosylanthranilate isomerase
MTWIKICGITNLGDAMIAVEAGADAVGFVFHEKSPRYVSREVAASITKVVPKRVERIGVFANASPEQMQQTVIETGMTAVQVCTPGSVDGEVEGVEQLTGAGTKLKLLPVLPMERKNPEEAATIWNPATVYAFLLDSGFGGQAGGTGQSFDWAGRKRAVTTIKGLAKIVIAGGLNAENVGDAIRTLEPWGVDVSSGVEARPGKKDPHKVKAFIEAVRSADRQSR